MNAQAVKLTNLITTGLQVRCAMNKDVVAEYAEAMKEGAKFPPVIVFRTNEKPEATEDNPLVEKKEGQESFYLADGYHRVDAAREAGRIEIEAEIRDGGYNEALRFALQANAMHGLRLTNADKRRALDLAWKNRDKLFKTFLGQNKDGEPNGLPSSTQLALLTGVSQRRALNYISEMVEYKAAEDSEASTPEMESVKANLAKGLDRFGVPIPPKFLPVFRGASELRKLARQVRDMKEAIEEQFRASNLLYAAVPQQAVINLDNVMHEIRAAQPYCVCRACAGNGCYRCSDHGFMTRSQYNRVPDEYKAHGALADAAEGE